VSEWVCKRDVGEVSFLLALRLKVILKIPDMLNLGLSKAYSIFFGSRFVR
jgi:hypothetical protein